MTASHDAETSQSDQRRLDGSGPSSYLPITEGSKQLIGLIILSDREVSLILRDLRDSSEDCF